MGDVRMLESLQRRWTREVEDVGHLEYPERLKALGLFSMYGCLLRIDLVKIWKIFNGNNSELQSVFERLHHSQTRGHRFKLSVPRCYSDLRRRTLAVRCVNVWNSLPSSLVDATNVGSFKRGLDRFLGEALYAVL